MITNFFQESPGSGYCAQCFTGIPFLTFYLGTILDLQKSCKDNAKCSCIISTQLSPNVNTLHNQRTFIRAKKLISVWHYWAFQVVLVVKNLPANARDIRGMGLTPGLGRSPGGGYSNPLQYSCLENPMDGGSWWDTIYVAQRVRHDWSDLAHDTIN